MNILGINAFEEKPSACLVVDGRLTCFCAEERFTRQKGSYGHFPINAVIWCLKNENISLGNVDRIAFSWGCIKYPYKMLGYLARIRLHQVFKHHGSHGKYNNTFYNGLGYIYAHTPGAVRRKIRDSLRMGGLQDRIPEIVFVEHHIAHAYQAYYQSPFQDAAVLVADGSGEENCVSGFFFNSGSYSKKFSIDVPFSLGWFYAAFTAYLGFRPNMDEGKLMGLAAYGEKRKQSNTWIERLEKIIRQTDAGYETDPRYFKFGDLDFHPRYTNDLIAYITSYNPDVRPRYLHSSDTAIHLHNEYVDIAYAVQHHLEHSTQKLVQRLINATGCHNLCCAGGIFMNCKVNSSLQSNTDVTNIFVHPASSDDGACIGAAFYVSEGLGQVPRNILDNVQLGPRYTNDDVEEILKRCQLSYTKPQDICFKAAELISKEKTVGWFHGGAEMGARALGGRSIVAYPGNSSIKDKLNENVKFREVWRPYCPSMVNEKRALYIENPIETPFMIIARSATELLKKQAPSVTHVDGSIRPQTVNKAILPKWYHVIDSLKCFNCEPIVLNTSFNIRNESMVCSPYDAIRTFYASGLDALVLEDCLLVK